MPKEDFQLLCDTICSNIGSQTFLPVSFIPNNTSQTRHCNKKVGGIIPGEMKVAIAIRMLSGASYLDLVPLFTVMTSHVFQIFEDVVQWILRTFEFPLVRWLRERNWKALETLAADFAEKTAGVYYGPFGALDGLALRIKSPSGVPDPGNYWCRKGFYALNVQAICDRRKRFLWCNPSHKGSTHDSQAFDSSKLYELLTEMADELEQRGLFIVADSAYALSPFMQVPYDANEIKGKDPENSKDAYNFYLSSCRIHIECAFGELVGRFGFFWRTMKFNSLLKTSNVIKCTMLLQNFIIERREKRQDKYSEETFFENMDVRPADPQRTLNNSTLEIPRPIVGDNNVPHPGGRPSESTVNFAKRGYDIRQALTIKLAMHNMKRPTYSNMRYNKYSHVYLVDENNT
mmetsp:Transcript_24903/g.38381  ORF Transcript_24903/g.38381 Transcript_24903/m.38381 type:complete len:402 (+) Transcript_24903:78-1283(+)